MWRSEINPIVARNVWSNNRIYCVGKIMAGENAPILAEKV